MADDTRQPTPSGGPDQLEPPRIRRGTPRHDFPKSQAQKMWDALGNPAEPVNSIAGGTYNSAGGKPKELSWREAFSFNYQSNGPAFYQTPCARDSLLVGISSGGAVGGLRFVLKGLSSVAVSANYAVAGFVLTAGGMYYWCNQRRREEARGIAAAVAGMKMLHEKKAREKAAEEAAQAAAAAAKEEEQRRNQRWYKVW